MSPTKPQVVSPLASAGLVWSARSAALAFSLALFSWPAAAQPPAPEPEPDVELDVELDVKLEDDAGPAGTAGREPGEGQVPAKPQDQASPPPEKKRLLTLGIGVLGVVGGDFLDKPSDRTLPGSPHSADIYPGFAGLTAGGGLMFDARFFDLIGLELDVYRSSDRGAGTLTINGVDSDISLGQGAWHLPLLLKLTVPTRVVRPMLFVGPEFVLVGAPHCTVTSQLPDEFFSSRTSDYTLVTFGLGLEIKLPVKAVDLRIPFTLRGSYNPGVSDKLADRMRISDTKPQGFDYDSNWQFQALATLGVAAYFSPF